MATAGDVQKLFLQAVISRRVVPIKLAKILWQKSIEAVNGSLFSLYPHRGSKGLDALCTTAADADLGLPFKGDQASWDNFVKKINESLNTLDLEFRHLHDEQTGREMLALVSDRTRFSVCGTRGLNAGIGCTGEPQGRRGRADSD